MKKSGLTLPPLALYVHIPWCLKKCPYCDFNSHTYQGGLPETAYINKLLVDLQQDLFLVQGRELLSIFIGGGTPSLFSPASIARLLSNIEKLIPFSSDIEITMEANPGTFGINKFKGFRIAGVNRLSIGIQSFNKRFLHALGRVHNDEEAHKSAANVRSTGFENFNLDLMFGLPDQSSSDAMADLDTALKYEPPHLSWYQLTIEPNTVFFNQPPALPDIDLISDIQDQGIALLSNHNFSRYEVSAFSAAGKQARHNINYWQFGDYLGIGAGAHGKITHPESGKIIRTRKTKQPSSYLEKSKELLNKKTEVKAEDLPLEFLMNSLRLSDGCDEFFFEQRTGLPITLIKNSIEGLRASGMIRKECLATTDKGFRFLNDVLNEFLPLDNPLTDRISVRSN